VQKKLLVVLVLTLIVILFAQPLLANNGEGDKEDILPTLPPTPNSFAAELIFDGFDPDKYVNEDGKRMNAFERAIATPLWQLMRAVVQMFRLEPIESLIFNRPMQLFSMFSSWSDQVSGKGEPKFFQGHNAPEIGGLFYEGEWNNIVKPPFEVFRNIALTLLGITVVTLGIKVAMNSGNPIGRAESKEAILNLLITAILIGMMLIIVMFIMDLNIGLVATVEDGIDESLLTKFGEGDSAFVTLRLTETLSTGSWFFTFFAYGYLIFLTIYFNVLYLLRKFVVMVLIIVGPVVVWAWGRGHQMSLYLWLSELISNIFMQSAHAIVFMLYFNIAANAQYGVMGSPVGKLLLLLMLVPVGLLLRKLITTWFNIIGLDEEATAGGILGGVMGGFAGFAGIGGGVTQSLMPTSRAAAGGIPKGAAAGAAGGGAAAGAAKGGAAVGATAATKGAALGSFLGPPGALIGGTVGAIGSIAGGLIKATAAPVGAAVGAGSQFGDNAASFGNGMAGAGNHMSRVFLGEESLRFREEVNQQKEAIRDEKYEQREQEREERRRAEKNNNRGQSGLDHVHGRPEE